MTTLDQIASAMDGLSKADRIALLRRLAAQVDDRPIRVTQPYRTPSTDGGACLVNSIVNVNRVLDEVEGPGRR